MANSLTSAQQKELKDAFDTFDSDGSGKISQNELGSVFKALKIPVTESQLKKVLAQMDSDGSGQIDFNEFCRVMGESYFKKYTQSELQAAFRLFDQDGSGFIQTSELESIMNKLGRHLTKSQIDGLVKSLDVSGDGQLSFEEFARLF